VPIRQASVVGPTTRKIHNAKIVRVVLGTLLVIAILAVTFALLRPWTRNWGATEAEMARALPGDELIERTPADGTHGATIDASPVAVWPWIAQMGDERGGFYSYTFIENLLQKTAGGEPVYHNANQILPQFQNPQPGQGVVMDSLEVYDAEPGKWLLAAQRSDTGEFNWVWLWHIEPAGTDQTRLLVRMALRLPGVGDNPVVGTLIDVGAFVMGRRMVEGLRLRAEGRSEPAAMEIIEIVLWLGALAAGLGAAVLFVSRRAWQAPLLLGLAALLALIWFTVWQPSIWLRLLLDLVLFALLWWVVRSTQQPAGAPRPEGDRA
jgi:hypothetical protein